MLEAARIVMVVSLSALFIGMGALHFRAGPARTMAAIVPPILKRPGWPSAMALVRFTGACEIAGGIGLLIPATRIAAGIALVLFLIAVFPANAYAAAHPERFGRLAIPFWPRLVGQLALIGLILFAAL